MTIDEARETLRTQKGSLKSKDMVKILEAFGFEAETSKTSHHYTVSHAQLSEYGFHGWNFNGGHTGDTVRKSYCVQLRTLLNNYKDALEDLGYGKD